MLMLARLIGMFRLRRQRRINSIENASISLLGNVYYRRQTMRSTFSVAHTYLSSKSLMFVTEPWEVLKCMITTKRQVLSVCLNVSYLDKNLDSVATLMMIQHSVLGTF